MWKTRGGAWLLSATLGLADAGGPGDPCGTERATSPHFLTLHDYWRQTGAVAAAASARGDRDEDHVALLEDQGDLVVRRNPFDLDGAALRFRPNAQGGYDADRLALALDPPGTPLAPGDDGAQAVDLPFAFPFFGERYLRAFVHPDGALTFGAPDPGNAERGLARFLAGPPRVAPFFADLDPGRGGSLSVQFSSVRAAFSWNAVPGAGQLNRNSFQVSLLPSGEIEVVFGAEMQTREGIVGVAPGGSLGLTAADLGTGTPRGSRGALLERFSETEELDLVSTLHRFYATHPDAFDQVVVYTTRGLNPLGGSLAFAVNVRNEVEGLGLERLDQGAAWASPASLQSVVFMDAVDPYLEVDAFEILAHEVGHRWLASLRFHDPAGGRSAALLGRGGSHWSFFLDSDGSVMEGNDLADRGGGRFETVDFARGYSALDQYAMGLRAAREVPPFFYVEKGDDFRPNRPYKASSAPEAGVSFTGVRRDVRIEDVVAALGPRVPDAAHANRVWRQAFVLVSDAREPASEPRRRAVGRIRRRFEAYYAEATDGRGLAQTTLP